MYIKFVDINVCGARAIRQLGPPAVAHAVIEPMIGLTV